MIYILNKIVLFCQIIKRISIFGIILFICSCNGPADSPYSSVTFTPQKSIPGNGRSSAVAFSINGKGYVALGRDSLHHPLNDYWEYDPITVSWSQKKSFPGIGRVKAIAATLNGKAYLGLGFNPDYSVYSDISAYLKDFWMYDSVTDVWIRKSDFPGSGCDACVAFEYGNEIYVGAGFSGYGFGHEFWKYNPVEDSWTQIASFPGTARTGSVVCTNAEHIYFGTGYDTYNENDWWEYLPASDSWKQLKSMPDQGRENAVALSINNRFFVTTGCQFGGDLTGGNLKSDILEYDAIRNVWYNRGSIPNGNRQNAIGFVLNGKGYIGFGENANNVLNDFWSFEP